METVDVLGFTCEIGDLPRETYKVNLAVTGNTYNCKEELKALHFWYNHNSKKWFYTNVMGEYGVHSLMLDLGRLQGAYGLEIEVVSGDTEDVLLLAEFFAETSDVRIKFINGRDLSQKEVSNYVGD